MDKSSQCFRVEIIHYYYYSFTLHRLGGDANAAPTSQQQFFLLYVHGNRSPQQSSMLISEALCTCSSHCLSRNTYTHDIYWRWQFYLSSLLFQAWPKQTTATAKTKHPLSRQTRAWAAQNGRGFAMPQICRICAFHDYVNFRFKTNSA